MTHIDSVELPADRPRTLAPLLEKRVSSRSFASAGITLSDLGQVLWSGLGRRADSGRVVPSAHALHALSVVAVIGDVTGLETGAYLYDSRDDTLSFGERGDHRDAIAAATLADRDWVATAPVLLIVTAALDLMNAHFEDQPPRGHRGELYAYLEAGHISQNIYLAAAELDLAVVLVAGIDDDRLSHATRSLTAALSPNNRALALIALGARVSGQQS
ncbi:MAG: SagB/ThcOx family dehydrogenase [Microbacteriaceae bacterium]